MEYSRDRDTPVTVAVVEAVGSFENRDPIALPPLHEVVNTDALDALFETERDVDGDGRCSVSFEFSDSHVTVESGDRIVVEADSATPAARS